MVATADQLLKTPPYLISVTVAIQCLIASCQPDSLFPTMCDWEFNRTPIGILFRADSDHHWPEYGG
jgi:hypothetical protein